MAMGFLKCQKVRDQPLIQVGAGLGRVSQPLLIRQERLPRQLRAAKKLGEVATPRHATKQVHREVRIIIRKYLIHRYR